MKILFIAPPGFNEITTQVSRYVTGESGFQPPLGLLYLYSYLRANGFEDLQVIDCHVEKLSYNELKCRIEAIKPDLVGITALTFTMVDVMKTVDFVKSINPDIKTVLGGTHVDIYPKETISLNNVDFVIMGEGEIPILELVRALDERKNNFDSIKSLGWKDGSKIHINSLRTEPNDLDSLPFPDRRAIPYREYYSIMAENNPITTMITAKGCPYSCTFCYEQGKLLRYRSPENIVREMLAIRELGIKEVFFVDDTFYINNRMSIAICNEIIKQEVGMPWGARARVNNLTEDVLLKFKEAGCVRLSIGVEAGTDKVLKTLNKKITVDQAMSAFRLCQKVGIDALAYFIIGSPGETLEDVEKTIKLAIEVKPTYAQFSRMTPFPKTSLYAEGLERNMYKDYWGEFAKNPRKSFAPPFWEENFSSEELITLADEATRKFYMRFSYFAESVLRIRSFNDLKRKAKAFLGLFLKSGLKRFKLKMN